MYSIVQGIAIPEDLPRKPAGAPKYPFGDMKVGDSFVVPYGDRKDKETDDEFRNRISKSARNFAGKDFNSQKNAAGDANAKRKDFLVAVMTKDDTEEPKRFVQGDAVVWRQA